MNILKKYCIKWFLYNWSKTSKNNSEKKYFHIVRSYTCDEFYVEVYWDIFTPKEKFLIDELFLRLSWEQVIDLVRKYESILLPKILTEWNTKYSIEY